MIKKQEGGRIADLLHQAVEKFEKIGIEEARIDAELLLSFCLKKSRTELYLAAKERLTTIQAHQFSELVNRRIRREPVAYITGEREFWSYTFDVTPDVLIPRPETEILVDMVMTRRNHDFPTGKCLDLCCGSGILAIVLVLELDLNVVAVDISAKALDVCKQNCIKHGVEKKVALVQADLGSCFLKSRPFYLITVNPPYVLRAEMDRNLQPEVVNYEPHLALDGGQDGLEKINNICLHLPSLLAPGGDFFMEIGADQASRVKALLQSAADNQWYQVIDVFKDYAGRDRVIHVRRKK